MLSIAVHVKLFKFFRWLSKRENLLDVCSVCAKKRFLVYSVCDKIVSAYAQHAHAIILKNYSKILISNENFNYKKSKF
jgi:hypothetical protein